jgi:hypothetical protein
VCRNHGTQAPRFAEGVGKGAGSGISGLGGSGVSEEILKGVGVQVAGVLSVAYAVGVSDKFATAGRDSTVRLRLRRVVTACVRALLTAVVCRNRRRAGSNLGCVRLLLPGLRSSQGVYAWCVRA